MTENYIKAYYQLNILQTEYRLTFLEFSIRLLQACNFQLLIYYSFLKIGQTLAIFMSFGTIPLVIDKLTKYVMGFFKIHAPSLRNRGGIPSKPVILLGLSCSSFFNRKFSSTGVNSKDVLFEHTFL